MEDVREKHPALAKFIEKNPLPSLAFLPDLGRDGFICFFLREYAETIASLLADERRHPIWRYAERAGRGLLTAEFRPEGETPYTAVSVFNPEIPAHREALQRLNEQDVWELHLIDEKTRFHGTRRYPNPWQQLLWPI